MAPLRYAAKFDPFLSLDCDPAPSTLAQERKGSNFAIWQPWRDHINWFLTHEEGYIDRRIAEIAKRKPYRGKVIPDDL